MKAHQEEFLSKLANQYCTPTPIKENKNSHEKKIQEAKKVIVSLKK